ncbi:MAG TPA: hypothetical protein VGH89_02580 [Pseudonocardia sp.]|jgi:hypothetical protein
MDLTGLGAWLFRPGVRDVFRLETLDGYVSTGDQPHYDRWRQGLTVEVNDAWRSWLDRIADDASAGITRRRVHVMSEPLTEHNLFECGEQYTRNGRAGEEVRIMIASPAERAGLRDFWMLDREQVAVMDYDPTGRFRSAWIADGPRPWTALAWALWRSATPFEPWWAKQPHHHGRGSGGLIHGARL